MLSHHGRGHDGGTMTQAQGTQRAALRNGPLVRYVASVALNVTAEEAVFIGVLVYAFGEGGAEATGYAAIALLLPYLLFAPIAGSIADRHPPQRVRIGAMLVQLAGFAVGAFAAYRDLPIGFVVAACMVGLAATTALGPAGAVLRPAIVRSSRELTVANLWVGYADNASVLAGPALATVALVIGGAPAVIAACVAATLLALVSSLISRPVDPPGGSTTTDQIGALALMRRNIAEVRLRSGVSGVLAIAGGQFFVVGALDIVIVVLAESRIDLGDSGAGILNSMLGVGAVLSGIVSTALIRRRRLAPILIGALLLTAGGTLALGLAISVPAALLLLPVIGLARSELDLLSRVLLQRSIAPDLQASVFAVIELAAGVGLILGSISAQLLIAASGVEAALYGIAGFFVLLLIATLGSLRTADASADVPVVAMSLLRNLPVFAPLPRPALELVARSAEELHVGPGTTVIAQGEAGDRFYAVADGCFEITVDGHVIAKVERGGGFGEIALLADVPRTAAVESTRAGTLLAIDRAPFLVAVTGHDSSRQAAWGVVHSMSPGNASVGEPLEYPDDGSGRAGPSDES
jgi:MFS family permease